MTSKTRIAALAALVAASFVAPASAQEEFYRHWVTGFVGGTLFDVTSEFDDVGANFQKDYSFGARYQYNFSPRWGVEGSVLFTPEDTELLQVGREVSVDTLYYMGNAVYNILPGKKIAPYATGGAGLVTLDVQGEGDTENYVGFNFGGGVKIAITPRVAFSFDARDYVYVVDDIEPANRAQLLLPNEFDQTIHDLSINFGVNFSF